MENFNLINRIDPCSIEAEQSVLGSILLNKDNINIALYKVSSEHFYKKENSMIFECMVELFKQNISIDIITLNEVLKDKGAIEAAGGINYITSLATIVPVNININCYLDIIIEKYNRRQCINASNQIIENLYSGKIEDLEAEIENLKSIITNKKKIEDLYIDASSIGRDDGFNEFISTGFEKLDEMLDGGFKCTSLTILTGEPCSGKSTVINQILAGAIDDGHSVFLYSGELPGKDLMKWFNCTVANKYHIVDNVSDIGKKNKDVSDLCWDLVSSWVKNKLIIYGDDSIANKKNMVNTIEHLVINKNIKLFVIDNLMTFDIENSEKQYHQQKILCLELKALARKYNIAIILVAHPKKPMGTERPSIYDVSGASEIVGCADTVIRIMRGQDEREESKILLLKNRWGGIVNRAIRVKFSSYRKRFYTEGENELRRVYGYEK